ncbi:Vacuolar protein sorting-associated protein VTA1 [Nakaseomyces bracarensis]|uniref:Vacuolar protein sorting-associated protein VTA1 n=1 Tax=Nakaseomyces bracarensis TaxID=273131 RepID=A0ABR4NYS8_9SACH
MIDSGTVRLIATANDMERAGLAVVAYYIRLYAVERLLSGAGATGSGSAGEEGDTCTAHGSGARSEEVTAAATDLLDQIETFKREALGDESPEAEGVKVLLKESNKAMVYVLNFTMSLYNDKLSQVSAGPYDRTLRQGLWCCIDLFNAVIHLWSKELKDPSKIAERIKYCKIYLSKLAKGELDPKKTEEEQDTEIDAELNKLVENENSSKDNDLDYQDFLTDEIPGEGDEEVDQTIGEPEVKVQPADVDDLINKLKLEDDEPPIEFPKKEPNVDEDEEDSSPFTLPSAPVSKPELRGQPAFIDSEDETDRDIDLGGSENNKVDADANKEDDQSNSDEIPVTRTTHPSQEASQKPEKKQYSSNDLMAMMDRSSKIDKVQRFAKYAISALNYEDIPTARDELTKALNLLDTL